MWRRIVLGFLFLLMVNGAAQAAARVSLEGRTLRITGTDDADTIVAEVSDNPAAITLDRQSFPLESFDRLELSAGGGADFVNLIDPGGLLDGRRKTLRLDGGDGENVVLVTQTRIEPETVARVRALLDISAQLEDIVRRASDATNAAVAEDAIRYIEQVRVNVADVSRALAAESQTQVFGPARELLERTAPQVVAMSETLQRQQERLRSERERLAADLSRQFDPTGGVFPPDVDRRPPPDAPETVPDVDRTNVREDPEPVDATRRIAAASDAAFRFGTDAQAQLNRAGVRIEADATAIERRTNEFEGKALRLEATANELAAQGEKDLTASADRVVAVVAEVRDLSSRLQSAALALRDEISRAVTTASAAANPSAPPAPSQQRQAGSGAACSGSITPVHVYTGGPGPDVVLVFWSTASWSINGAGGPDILVGGMAADDIRGGAGNDLLAGFGGDDYIRGGDGTDVIAGDFFIEWWQVTGADCVWGDDGNDFMAGDNFVDLFNVGHPGLDDTLFGGKGVDLIAGDDVLDVFNPSAMGGADTIEGGDDTDLIFGTGGDDPMLDGNDGIDFIMGNGGDDTINGHDGKVVSLCNTNVHLGNLLLGNPGKDTVNGGKGTDIIFGGPGVDTLTGNDQVDLMFGGGDGDIMHGNDGGVVCVINGVPIRFGNVMFGGDDGDTMDAGGDLDLMFGQSGPDVIHGYDGSLQQPFAVDADLILGGTEPDDLWGDQEEPALNASLDWIFGEPGNDAARGGRDSDFLFGGADSDWLLGDSNSPTLITSIDLILGNDGGDWADGGNGLDVILGGPGADTLNGDNSAPGLVSPDLIIGGPDGDTEDGGSNLDVVIGNDGDDRMFGDQNIWYFPFSHDFMFGGNGRDDMDGGNGGDFMWGQDGCDTMQGDNSSYFVSLDFISGGNDDDIANGGASPDLVFGDAGNDTVWGDQGGGHPLSADLVFGGDGCDVVHGGDSLDVLFGNAGIDEMYGEGGPDVMFGNDGSDTMSGGNGPDFMFGNDQNDLLHGDDGLDWLFGNSGDDCLYGDNGIDFLFGNDGADCLHGGNGPDFGWGGSGDDRMFGDAQTDGLHGNDGDDEIDGGGGFDRLWGNAGDDELWGGPSSALIFGGPGSDTIHPWGSSGLDCDCHIDTCKGRVCIRKFNDPNANGTQNSGEGGLANWVFQVTCGCATGWLVTNANGDACGDFYSGTCTVTEITQSGWLPTTPVTQTVNVSAGGSATATFGNRRGIGELCIRKFNDLNGDGDQDTGEPGLSWPFTLVHSSGTTTTLTTNSAGGICTGVPIGMYTITEGAQSGWSPTTPATQTVTVNSGQATNAIFGNQQTGGGKGTICVQKFFDRDGNGVKDTMEPVLSGWSFQVVGPPNGTLTTVPGAASACESYPVGTYTITEVQQSGWTPTTPTTQSLTLTSGQTVTLMFGNRQ